jgi:hypothetical protein
MNRDFTAFALSGAPGVAAVNLSTSWLVVALIIVGLLVGNIWQGVLLYSRKRTRPQDRTTAAGSAEEFRVRLAHSVTVWAMIAIALLGVAIISIGGYNATTLNTEEARRGFLDTAKYVFAAVLPVVAAWVGTVMAFYFGKENYRAATESVARIVQLTSREKLGQTKAKDIGKRIEDVAPLRLGENDTVEAITLDKLEEKMRAKAPPFERLPILQATGAPLMVVHRSIFNDFLLKRKTAAPDKTAKDYKLSELVADFPWLTENSFATVSPDASAAQAKDAMEQKKGCADVFVTMNGTPATPVSYWITNVDLLQAAQV